MKKLELSCLSSEFSGNDFIFMLAIGFDQRCLSVIESLSLDKFKKIIGIYNINWVSLSEKNASKLKEFSKEKLKIIGGSTDNNIIALMDELYTELQLVSETFPECRLVVDITSFSHELLIAFLGVVNSIGILHRIELLYLGADKYSYNTLEGEGSYWLSRGLVEIRTVLGFPGSILPSKSLHLIVMTGFEVERAMDVISNYEPDILSVAICSQDKSVSREHHAINLKSHNKVFNVFASPYDQNCTANSFEFSCVDPFDTRDIILEHVAKFHEYNTVICPLNTKLSTVGAVLAALKNTNIQLCYPQAMEYNVDGYVVPGNIVTFVSLESLVE